MTTFPRRIAAIAGGVAIVIIALWYLTVFSPQSKNLKAAHAAHAAADAKIGQLTTQVQHLKVLVNEIPADQASLATLEQNLPDNPQLDSALNQLNRSALASGVTLESVGPALATTSGSATKSSEPSVSLSLAAVGTPGQVTNFLTQLAQMPRVVVVDRVSLSGTNPQTASISARIFYAGQPTP